MAKIRAYGAKEVCRLRGEMYIYLVTSDGRVLFKGVNQNSGWKLWRRFKTVKDAIEAVEKDDLVLRIKPKVEE